MIFSDYAYSVLVVSSSEKFNRLISKMLPESSFYPVNFASSAAEAGRKSLEKNFDIIIINSPLPDDQGIHFAIDITNRDSETGVILFVKSELYEAVTSKVTELGIITLAKPSSSLLATQAINILCAVREKLRRAHKKSDSLEDKMAEIRTVNHAKWLLIDTLKMSEEEAHRYIEKQAMDERCSKLRIAENIIRTYR